MSREYGNTPFFLASACLCGIPCRYDGRPATVSHLAGLYKLGLGVAVCPEVAGGLEVPRAPCEITQGRVFSADGSELTRQFMAGALYALRLALRHHITIAVLKDNSPSCGSSYIYDGSFRGVRIFGQGITTELLQKYGICIVNEHTYMRLAQFAAVAE